MSDDDFIHQRENRIKGSYPVFEKTKETKHMVLKTTRHHEMLERYLEVSPDINIFAIVRHPCAAIYSWVITDKEFSSKGCTIEVDWRSGACRKDGEGEYWGFEDWKDVTLYHQSLSETNKNFHLVKYSDLVKEAIPTVAKIYSALSVPMKNQTLEFIKESQSLQNSDPYSVYKNKNVLHKWKGRLQLSIVNSIIEETNAVGLGAYLEDS